MAEYLKTPIDDVRWSSDVPRYGVTRSGYSKRSGAPTALHIRLRGEKRWRRVMVWQFSNAGTYFVRVGGRPLIVDMHEIDAMYRAKGFRKRASSFFARPQRDRRSRRRSRRSSRRR